MSRPSAQRDLVATKEGAAAWGIALSPCDHQHLSQHMNHSKLAYTVLEACRLLSLSRAFVYRLIESGELESITIGRARRITSAQLDAFVQAREANNEPSASGVLRTFNRTR